MSRKRRSNRLTVEQLEAKRELREIARNQQVMMIAADQESVQWDQARYRTVSLAIAERMVRDGDAERRVEEDPNHGSVVMFRELKSFQGAQYHLPAMPNAACADALARSQDDGGRMTASDRRKLATVLLFPFDRDRKAPLAQRRVTDQDCRRAAELLGIRQPLLVAA